MPPLATTSVCPSPEQCEIVWTNAIGWKFTDLPVAIRCIANGYDAFSGLEGILGCIEKHAIWRKDAVTAKVPIATGFESDGRTAAIRSESNCEPARASRKDDTLSFLRIDSGIMATRRQRNVGCKLPLFIQYRCMEGPAVVLARRNEHVRLRASRSNRTR